MSARLVHSATADGMADSGFLERRRRVSWPTGGMSDVLRATMKIVGGERMEQRVSLREVNQHLTRYVKAAEAGDRIVITRRGKPVAVISPLPPQEKLLNATQAAALERILHQSHHLGGRAPLRDELHER
jgi:prevent-host-death family protein